METAERLGRLRAAIDEALALAGDLVNDRSLSAQARRFLTVADGRLDGAMTLVVGAIADEEERQTHNAEN